jgi:hypothetical protein
LHAVRRLNRRQVFGSEAADDMDGDALGGGEVADVALSQ